MPISTSSAIKQQGSQPAASGQEVAAPIKDRLRDIADNPGVLDHLNWTRDIGKTFNGPVKECKAFSVDKPHDEAGLNHLNWTPEADYCKQIKDAW